MIAVYKSKQLVKGSGKTGQGKYYFYNFSFMSYLYLVNDAPFLIFAIQVLQILWYFIWIWLFTPSRTL